jgi:hypothetical protein
MKLIRSIIYLTIIATLLSILNCCSTTGKSNIIIKPKKDDIEKLRTVKTMRIVIDQSYKYGKDKTIPFDKIFHKPPFEEMTQKFAEYAELKVVTSDSEHCDMEFNIKSEGVAVGAPYTVYGHSYSGANVSGKVVLEIQNKPVYQISFKGGVPCPGSIKGRSPPSSAPFEKALSRSSFRQNIVKMMGDIYGIDWLAAALFDVDGFVRNEAAKELGATNNSMAVVPLIDAINDDDSNLRWDVAKALVNVGDSRAVEPLINGLTKASGSHARVRLAIFDALGAIGDKRAVEPLIPFLKFNDDWELQTRAAEALAKIGDYRAIKPIIDAMEGKEEYGAGITERLMGFKNSIDRLADALKKLTGKNFGNNHKKWLKWWEQNKDNYISETQ